MVAILINVTNHLHFLKSGFQLANSLVFRLAQVPESFDNGFIVRRHCLKGELPLILINGQESDERWCEAERMKNETTAYLMMLSVTESWKSDESKRCRS